MKINLDRSVRYCEDSEHKSLYAWSLQETSAVGERLGRDLIPWSWTLRFLASELRVHRSYHLAEHFEGAGNRSVEARESSALVAKLRMDRAFSSEFREKGTKLSMIGSDREITDVSLRIEPNKDGNASERCTIWGCPSYTTEIDFRDHTFPDQLQIQVSATPARFRELCGLVSASRALSVNVMISRASGLYSDWSPAIATDSVKILTQEEAHAVAELPGPNSSVPRLGDVGDFELEVIQHLPVYAPQEDRSEVDAEPAGEMSQMAVTSAAPLATAVETAQRLLREQEITRKSIASLAVPLWIAVAALVAMWLTR
jgi:hypothetical protein